MSDTTSADDALARLEREAPDIHEAINQLVSTRDSPGFLVLLKYLDGLAQQALEQLVEADPLDRDEIIRLQNNVKRFRWFAEAPDELIRMELGREISEEHDAQEFID